MVNIDKLLSSEFDIRTDELSNEYMNICLEFRRTFPAKFAKLTKAYIDELSAINEDHVKRFHLKTMYGVNTLVLSSKNSRGGLMSRWADAVSMEISNFYERINFPDCIPYISLISKWKDNFSAYVLNAKDINDEFSRALNTPVTVIIDDLTPGQIALRIYKA